MRSVTTRTPLSSVVSSTPGSGLAVPAAPASPGLGVTGRLGRRRPPSSPSTASATPTAVAATAAAATATAVAASTAVGGGGRRTEVAELGADLVVEGVLERHVLTVAVAGRLGRVAAVAAVAAIGRGRLGRGCRRPSPRLAAGAAPARARDTLPFGSTSSTTTSISSPRSTTSSTWSMRLPPPELGDVEQAVTAREDVDEGTELGDVDDPALVGLRRPRPWAG